MDRLILAESDLSSEDKPFHFGCCTENTTLQPLYLPMDLVWLCKSTWESLAQVSGGIHCGKEQIIWLE